MKPELFNDVFLSNSSIKIFRKNFLAGEFSAVIIRIPPYDYKSYSTDAFKSTQSNTFMFQYFLSFQDKYLAVVNL